MEQPLGHGRVDIAGGFVRDQHFGPCDHRAGDRHPLLLAARQGRGARAGAFGQADPVEHLAHRARNLRFGHARDTQGERDIVRRAQMRDQAEILEHHADPPPKTGQPVARQDHRILAEQADDAPARPLREVKEPQQRRLARAARPGQEIELPGSQRETDVTQRLLARAVSQTDILELDDVRHARMALAWPAPRFKFRASSLPRLGAACLLEYLGA